MRHVDVAMSDAGVFLGVTPEDGPRVLQASIEGSGLVWSKPWALPVPPPRPNIEHVAAWTDYEESLAGVDLTIDELDPARIAVNLVEDQGGSYGIFIGRVNSTPLYVPYPFDSDLAFGTPRALRGSELFTHDGWAFF